ncbi:MAG TPA: class I SAM-dependent methyltransferase [Thiobacillaceae bacterium]|nr:class I SAM-dependent methyltransferase [Thiobacillaceae bacterium]HNU63477.1 class I SAM-dependent methyltransferase [Thiobacillaceae bacterium]
MPPAESPRHTRVRHLPPSLKAAIAHLPALCLGALLLAAGLPASLAALGVGVAAALLAWLWRLPGWWYVISLLFVPGLWLGLHMQFDAYWPLAGFTLLALTSLGAVVTRAPLYLSSAESVAALARAIPPHATFLDLGCGLGGPLSRLAVLRPDLRLQGVEAAPLNWLVARLRLGHRAHIRLGSLWQADLSGCDVAYAYLSSAPMPRLWRKVRKEMRPGSLFISNTFAIPGVPPDASIEISIRARRDQKRLLLWRLA